MSFLRFQPACASFPFHSRSSQKCLSFHMCGSRQERGRSRWAGGSATSIADYFGEVGQYSVNLDRGG